MIACRTPNRRSSTSATGVMQLVVQLAHEITCSPAGARFTPCTTGATVSARGGADRITSRAPPARGFLRSSPRPPPGGDAPVPAAPPPPPAPPPRPPGGPPGGDPGPPPPADDQRVT